MLEDRSIWPKQQLHSCMSMHMMRWTLLHIVCFFTLRRRLRRTQKNSHTPTPYFFDFHRPYRFCITRKLFRIISRSARNYNLRCVALAVAHAVAAQLLDQPTTPALAHKLQVGNQ